MSGRLEVAGKPLNRWYSRVHEPEVHQGRYTGLRMSDWAGRCLTLRPTTLTNTEPTKEV